MNGANVELNYLSLFSGIEAASCAWQDLPFRPAGFSEIEPFPCSVLHKRYPHVPNLGDIGKITAGQLHSLGHIDLIVGGSPCQGFSNAGLKKGLNDERSKLALCYVSVLASVRPRWFIWENVPGCLRTNGGLDFRCFVGALVKLGYGVSWRVLDAQYFGVPQQRKRVFLVGYYGDWRRSAQVLFECQGMQGDTAQSTRETQGTTTNIEDLAKCASPELSLDMSHACDVLRYYFKHTPTLTAHMGTGGNNVPLVLDRIWGVGDLMLRKLTPAECLQLQGFPCDWLEHVKGYSDSAAYRAIGNSMAVPVMRWIGQRIYAVESSRYLQED